jgi:hypothetical protein
MTGKDLNRSNKTGTGAKTLDREDFPPEADVQELSDKAGIAAEPQPAPSQGETSGGEGGLQGSSGAASADGMSAGGDLQREIGSIDEEKSAIGEGGPTSVHKGQRPDDGDEPNLPNQDGEQRL